MHRVVRAPAVRAVLFVAVATALSGCGGGSSATAGDPAAPQSASSTTSGAAPVVAGPRVDAAVADQPYALVPEIGDVGATAASYSIENKPAWATFDPSSGALSGVPTGADVGSRQRVRITVTAGGASNSHEVDLRVVATADGSAEVALNAPTTRTDGSALGDLAGYRIYYGKTAARLDHFVDVKDPGVAGAEVSGLTPGTWYFVATAYDARGFESEPTEVGSKTIG